MNKHKRADGAQARRAAGSVAVLALAAALSGCGGGGGGGGSAVVDMPTVEPTFDLDTTLTQAYTTGLHFQNLQAVDASGTRYVLAFDIVPSATTTFEGAPRATVMRTTSGSPVGATPVVSRSLQFLSYGPLRLIGSVTEAGTVTLTTRTGDLPRAARPGSSGPLYTSTQYSDASKATVVSTTEVGWSLEGVDTHQAWMCLDNRTPNPDPALSQSVSECLLLDLRQPGQVLGARVTYGNGSAAVVFR